MIRICQNLFLSLFMELSFIGDFLSCVHHLPPSNLNNENNKLKVSPLSDLPSNINCPLTPSSYFLLSPSIWIFGSCAGTFQSDLFSPRFLDTRRQETQKPKSQNGLSLFSSLPPYKSLPPRRVFVIPRWAKQTCVYQFTVAGQGGLSVCRPALCLSHCETQQQLDFSLTAC